MSSKHQRIIQLLEKYNLDGLIIRQISNFAWATDGAASYINTAAKDGVGTLLVTKDSRHLIANNIEMPRFENEENLKTDGWECHTYNWWQPSDILTNLTRNLRIGADGPYPGAMDLSGDLSVFRSYLDEIEKDRFRLLSSTCAQAMNEAILNVKPGMTEYQIASLLSGSAQKRGVLPVVNLIATDERIYKFRHPLPTSKKLDKYAMLVLCGRQKGLVCSLTRLIHFGPLSDELRKKSEAVAYIDAKMITSTQAGRTVSDVFQITKDAYAEVGFADEWQLHHQGGPAGYDPREFLMKDGMEIPIGIGQAYAWNPSITGCKSEDTIIVKESGNEILSVINDWPTVSINIDGQTIERPIILVVN